jgi:hypothetical protein
MVAAILAIVSAVTAIAELLVTIAALLGIITLIFDPKGKQKIAVLVANFVGGALGIAVPLLGDLEGQLAPVAAAFLKSLNDNGGGLAAVFRDPASAIAQTAFNDAANLLIAKGLSTPDAAVGTAADALGNAFGFGLASHAVTALFEAVFPEKLNSFNAAGPALAEMAGFAEVAGAVRAPLYENAFGKSLEYHYRSIFKPELPDEADAVLWHARRKLTDDQLKNIFNYSGLKAEYETPFIESAYRAISPFMLAAGFTNQDIDEQTIRDAAEFMGLQNRDVDLIIKAVQVRSIESLANSYVQEAMTAYGQGVVSDDELAGAFDDANWGAQAKALGQKRALLLRRINLARDAEATVVPEIRNGLLDEISGTTQLEDAGIQPWKAQLQATKANAGAIIAQRKKQLSDAQRLANERVRNLTRAAEAEFQRGNIDVAALTAALLAIPLDPIVAASIVAVQTAIAQGKQKFVYGKLRSATAAAALKLRVGTITEQIYKKVITPDQGYQELSFEDIDAATITQLVATAAAKAGLRFPPGPFIPPLKAP